MAASNRRILMAVLAAGIVAVAAFSGSASQAQTPPPVRPNVVVIMTDDQTVESMRVMPNVKALLADQGVTFDNSFVSYALCCPSRATYLTGQYAHNHGVWGNAAPNGGYYKLDSTNTLPVWLQRGGYQTIHLGKYLNGYGTRNATEVPPGWGEWYGSVDPTTYRFYNYTLNENGRTVNYGTGAANYQTDVYAQKAVDLIAAQAADPRPFFLSVAFLAPHSGGPRDPDDPPNLGTPAPAPRHRNVFRTQPLPIPPSFNEADVSDKPAAVRNRPLLTAGRINGIREMYQQRLESLLAVDEAVGADRQPAVGDREAREHVHHLHVGQRLLPRRAPRAAGEGAALRAVDPRAADHPRAEHPGRSASLAVRREHRPRADDRRRDRRPAGPRHGRALAAAVRAEQAPALRARPPARDADLRGDSDAELALCGARDAVSASCTTSPAIANQMNSLHNDLGLASVKANLAMRLARLAGCSGAACRKGPQLGLRSRTQPGRGAQLPPFARSLPRRRARRVAHLADGASTSTAVCSSETGARRSRSPSRSGWPASRTARCSRRS